MYTMKEKVSPTTSNRRKRELDIADPEHPKFEDLVTYKRKRKTVKTTTVVPPNTVEECPTNTVEQSPQNTDETEDVSEHSGAHIEDGYEVRVTGGSQIQSESAQTALGAQPMLSTDGDVNIDSDGENCEHSSRCNCEGKAAASNDEVNPNDTSLLRSFKFYRTRSIALGQEKVPLRIHHHPSTWDLTKEPQMGFPTLLEVFEKNLLLDLKAFKALKAGGAGNSLSLKKLRDHYAYKFEKVLSDGTAARAKKKGLTTKFVAREYMLYVLGSFLFPTKKGTDVRAWYLDLFAKDKAAKKWSIVLAHMYYSLGAASRDDGRQFACCITLLEVVWDPYRDKKDSAHGFKKITYFYGALASPDHVQPYYPNMGCATVLTGTKYPQKAFVSRDDDAGMFGIHQKNQAPQVNEDGDTPLNEHATVSSNAHDTMPTRAESCRLDKQIKALNDELHKLKEDKDQESKTILKLAEALKEKISECNLLRENIDQMKEDMQLKRVLDEQCALAYVDLPAQLDAKILNWTSKYKKEAARVMEETNDLRKKLVNTEEMKKSLEVNNNEWEVWHQSLKKALASEGMGDMGDPTFEELYDQNERFFAIAQQGPNGDYQEDLVSTGVTLENVVIARRENMAKKKKLQKVLFQPWTKYLLDVRGVETSNNNSAFRVTAMIQHQSQHRFPDVIKSLKTFLYRDPIFWKSIFSQTLGIQFTPDSENAYRILLHACSFGH
ncbi:hypothetical protein GIB67_037950 [Kingdonia uniflora]|uniref:Uncharacterized protein n=1 Tax=Kingdonia uniflora TaxID=39325 RepID=A0A7J7LHC5_9MAGN|nr:hypothetical protein GIB67_037950 [Kingdonia uniflora]